MKYFIDVANYSVNKYGEELCGDNVEYIKLDNGFIIVLADGLGSGVKANILATLTSKIAITMLKEGASIEETIDTMTGTLPECQIRKLAYSTFTIVKINNDGEVYMVEYDNPSVFFFKNNRPKLLEKKKRVINNKDIYESHFIMDENDVLTIVSDGVIHAGVGMRLNLGWQWDNVNKYLAELVELENNADQIAANLMNVCESLYENKPGDDTTVVAIKTRPIEYVDVFTGPPENREDDDLLVHHIQNAKGRAIICGGTTANIVSKKLDMPIEIDLVNYTKDVPPQGYMEGVDLVTEGLLTLNKVKEILQNHYEMLDKGLVPTYIKGRDGASNLARILLYESTHIHLWVGKAINPAHQNPDFPWEFNLKIRLMEEIKDYLEKNGKNVEISYL
ncbi:MAG: SpoIIE family protein phosphatase [Epulopiscium sp.]|nr:SpoIIE family protein phosphatase [Candidatus Epulonipiscium sp.]